MSGQPSDGLPKVVEYSFNSLMDATDAAIERERRDLRTLRKVEAELRRLIPKLENDKGERTDKDYVWGRIDSYRYLLEMIEAER